MFNAIAKRQAGVRVVSRLVEKRKNSMNNYEHIKHLYFFSKVESGQTNCNIILPSRNVYSFIEHLFTGIILQVLTYLQHSYKPRHLLS